jgi:hypothetical protein
MNMNTLKLVFAATTLLTAATVQAATCDGFEIKIKNHLADDLIVTNIGMDGAELQPGGIQKLNANQEQVFTVNASKQDDMKGHLTFRTMSIPSKTVKIRFDLKNSGLICEHTDTSPDTDYQVDKIRLPGKVDYTILNK